MMKAGTKPRVLFVMQLPPPVHGVSVMNRIIRESTLLNDTFACDYINLTTAKSIHDLGKGGFGKYLSFFSIFFRAFAKMLTRRYACVYITIFPYGLAFYKDSAIVLMARLFGLRPVLHMHVHGIRKASGKSAFRKMYYRFVFRHAEVICLSERLQEDIEPVFQGKVHILPNGIPQVNFENHYNGAQNPLTLLYLSNLIKSKGILLLMDAIELLKQKPYHFHARIVGAEGDITYHELKEMAAAKGIESYITLAGPKYNDDKFDEFRQAGIFVFPTSSDTFGLVLLEAMQFGVPCISTPVGGIPDVLGDNRGFIIGEIEAQALAGAIESLLADPARRLEMSSAGFTYFQHNYTTAVFEQRLISILNTVILSV